MAEEITNGGFETGDLTGWSKYERTGGYVDIITDAHSGIYSLEVNVISDSNEELAYIAQSVDLTDVDSLTFWYMYEFFEEIPVSYEWSVWIDNRTKIASGTDDVLSWTYKSIDVSAYSGSHTIKFQSRAYDDGYGDSYFYVDDISAIPPVIGNAIMFGCNF